VADRITLCSPKESSNKRQGTALAPIENRERKTDWDRVSDGVLGTLDESYDSADIEGPRRRAVGTSGLAESESNAQGQPPLPCPLFLGRPPFLAHRESFL
jgi:hypothetical protein